MIFFQLSSLFFLFSDSIWEQLYLLVFSFFPIIFLHLFILFSYMMFFSFSDIKLEIRFLLFHSPSQVMIFVHINVLFLSLSLFFQHFFLTCFILFLSNCPSLSQLSVCPSCPFVLLSVRVFVLPSRSLSVAASNNCQTDLFKIQ